MPKPVLIVTIPPTTSEEVAKLNDYFDLKLGDDYHVIVQDTRAVSYKIIEASLYPNGFYPIKETVGDLGKITRPWYKRLFGW